MYYNYNMYIQGQQTKWTEQVDKYIDCMMYYYIYVQLYETRVIIEIIMYNK